MHRITAIIAIVLLADATAVKRHRDSEHDGDLDWDPNAHDPPALASLRRLARTRRLTPAEKAAYSTAQLGPTVEDAPPRRHRNRFREPAANTPATVPSALQPDNALRMGLRQHLGDEGADHDLEDAAVEQAEPEEQEAQLWIEVQRHPADRRGVRAQAKAVLGDLSYRLTHPKLLRNALGQPFPYILAYCRHHASSDGELCPYMYRFVIVGDTMVEYRHGEHHSELSPVALRRNRARVADNMASQPAAVSSQYRTQLHMGRPASSLPSPSSVYKRRSEGNSEVRADGGASNSELEAELQSMAYNADDPPGTLFFDAESSDIPNHILIFHCRSLLQRAVQFSKTSGLPLRLCADATHDIGLQKWKLLAVGFLAAHFSRGAWRTTFVPMAYAIAIQENRDACQALLESTVKLLCEAFEFNLAEHTASVHLDGGAALLKAFGAVFPEVPVKRCVEHVKKNMLQASRELSSSTKRKEVRTWVHRSAFLAPALFSMFWHGALNDLREDGGENFAEWLLDPARGGHLQLDKDTGLITAAWQSSLAHIQPPFSTYAQNSIESSWRAMDLAMDDMPNRVDIISEIRFLKQLTRTWEEVGRHVGITPEVRIGTNSSHASAVYLRGKARGTAG